MLLLLGVKHNSWRNHVPLGQAIPAVALTPSGNVLPWDENVCDAQWGKVGGSGGPTESKSGSAGS